MEYLCEFIPEDHLEKSFKKLGFKITTGLWISCMLVLLAVALPLLITGIKDFNKLKESENQTNHDKSKKIKSKISAILRIVFGLIFLLLILFMLIDLIRVKFILKNK